jgi:hypothetical protein
MSIAKRVTIENIKKLVSDQILREQLIDLHLGKLTEDQIREIREEREREAEEILKLFNTDLSMNNIDNGQTEVHRNGDNRDKNDISINEIK